MSRRARRNATAAGVTVVAGTASQPSQPMQSSQPVQPSQPAQPSAASVADAQSTGKPRHRKGESATTGGSAKRMSPVPLIAPLAPSRTLSGPELSLVGTAESIAATPKPARATSLSAAGTQRAPSQGSGPQTSGAVAVAVDRAAVDSAAVVADNAAGGHHVRRDSWPDAERDDTRIVQRTLTGARFVLQFSTGESVTVTGSGIVGRNPSAEPSENVDTLVAITDPGKSVSKTHLEFGQSAGALWVSDRFSGNGTVIREPDSSPKRCDPGKRYLVVRGTRIDIGEQFFVVS